MVDLLVLFILRRQWVHHHEGNGGADSSACKKNSAGGDDLSADAAGQPWSKHSYIIQDAEDEPRKCCLDEIIKIISNKLG